MSETIDEFKNKLIDTNITNPFPYVDPHNSWKAPMFIDTANYIEWYEQMILKANSQGYCISFIVGDPGAGKTHFLCHLNHLYYNEKKFNGIYAMYSAHEEERISSRGLWESFFTNDNVVDRIRKEIRTGEVENYTFNNISMRKIIMEYLNNPEAVSSFNSMQLLNLASGLSQLINYKGMHISIIIDNIDEYFRWLNNLRSNNSLDNNDKQDYYGVNPNDDDFNTLFSTLRSTATNVQGLLLILACTRPAYNPITSISVDRTYAGRVTYQDKILGPLTNSQAYELVSMYMNYWVKILDIHQPITEECLIYVPNNSPLNLYPFTKTSIDEIYKVTGQYARDIKTICCEAIDEMKIKKDMWIVKDHYLAEAITEAHKKRPQIVPKEKLDEFYNRRSEWIRSSISSKINKLTEEAHRKYKIITKEKMAEILDTYIQLLNFNLITDFSSIRNTYNPNNWTNKEYLRIINININENQETGVLISYIFSDKPPINRSYFREIKLKDQTDVNSYFDNEFVSHALFIRLWSKQRPGAVLRNSRARELNEVIEDISIDEHIYRIIAAVEGTQDVIERSDLVEHVDRYYFHLRTLLEQLVEKTGQPVKSWEERLREMRRRAAEF